MDHEKPQAVSQFTIEYESGEMSRSTDYSDLQHGRTPSIIDLDEVEQVEETRERRGEKVWYVSDWSKVLWMLHAHMYLGECWMNVRSM